jgi:hypothetical protein
VVDNAVYLSYCVLSFASSDFSDDAVAAYLEEDSGGVFSAEFGYEVGS